MVVASVTNHEVTTLQVQAYENTKVGTTGRVQGKKEKKERKT